MSKPLPSFEWLKDLAEKDPEALERLRKQYIEDTINSASEEYRHRLRGLQFQIDGQRRLAKNPMEATIAISKMMHDSLYQMKAFIEGLDDAEQQPDEVKPATVLTFRRNQG